MNIENEFIDDQTIKLISDWYEIYGVNKIAELSRQLRSLLNFKNHIIILRFGSFESSKKSVTSIIKKNELRSEFEILSSYTNWESYYEERLGYAHPPALLEKAKILINNRQFEEAQEALDKAIKHVEENGYTLEEYNYRRDLWFQKARIAAFLGDKEKVMNLLGKMLSIIREIQVWVEKHRIHTGGHIMVMSIRSRNYLKI